MMAPRRRLTMRRPESNACDMGAALIDANDVVISRHGQFGRPDRNLNDAGAVDEHLDRTDLRLDRCRTSLGRLFVTDVGLPA